MANKFIFDVDGTLTPSRGRIDSEFAAFFFDFSTLNKVYIVTGSDKPKTVEQIGNVLYGMVKRVYNCSGNDVWEGSTQVRKNDWTLPDDAHEWLAEHLTASAFSVRTGKHFEHRTGMINFSIVGRNANSEQRKMYVDWDERYDERDHIAYDFNLVFPDLVARPGGETGIDIMPRGADKSQILQDFDKDDYIIFFGDRMDQGGNDYPLAFANTNGKNHHVKDWKHTWEILKNEYSTNGS